MLRKPFFLLCLLLFVGADRSAAQGVAIQDTAGNRLNSWSARSSTGLRLMGTWTVIPDSTSGTVTGAWTLIDRDGRTLAAGKWSAAKSQKGWTGSWRAAVADHEGDYAGTWSAGVNLKPEARFADLFEKALRSVVSGRWRTGTYSGTWSIQAFKREDGQNQAPTPIR